MQTVGAEIANFYFITSDITDRIIPSIINQFVNIIKLVFRVVDHSQL